ncbi:ATP-binding protein [Catenulispora rubra]|uniref:ATP-binding protein n=1 Tax=Catenulispora rubra TaxID=280293 RepID=UPI00189201FA|nr:ATP-binding protein [Catenulispora rubra]
MPIYLHEIRQLTAGMLQKTPGHEDVVQIVSELAANAILHTASGEPGGTFTIHLAAFTNRWQVRVDDAGSLTTPQVLPVAEDNVTAGGGLAIVAALASTWSVFGDQYGRAVLVEIPFPPQETGSA